MLYPEIEVTKRQLADFYVGLAAWMLPHIRNRPLALLRCPGGRDDECFYQEHLGNTAPPELRQVKMASEKSPGEGIRYAVVDDLPDLVSLVQIGVLEIHPRGATADAPDRPDRLFFDLDPGPEETFADLIAAAEPVHDALDRLGLHSFVKLTGGKGLHVVVPLAASALLH